MRNNELVPTVVADDWSETRLVSNCNDRVNTFSVSFRSDIVILYSVSVTRADQLWRTKNCGQQKKVITHQIIFLCAVLEILFLMFIQIKLKIT